MDIDAMNFYQLLEVEPTADLHEIEIAYRRLVRLGGPESAFRFEGRERLARVQQAITTLRNPDMRAAYDEDLRIRLFSPPGKPVPTLTEIVVSPTAPGASSSLAEALAAAPLGTRVRVLPGMYTGPFAVTRPVEIVGDGLTREIRLLAAGADCLTITADHARVRNLSISAAGEGTAGVRILRGRAEVLACEVTGAIGAEVAGPESQPVFRRCTFHEGEVGVRVRDGARPTFEECRIFTQSVAGVQVEGGAVPTLRQCFVRGATRGAVIGAAGVFDGCHIAQSTLAGIVLDAGADPLFTGCTVVDGAGPGVIAAGGSLGTLRECTVATNTGDGVRVEAGGNPTVVRCTVEHNGGSGVAVARGGGGHFEGCSLAANTGKAWNVAWGSKVYRRWNKE